MTTSVKHEGRHQSLSNLQRTSKSDVIVISRFVRHQHTHVPTPVGNTGKVTSSRQRQLKPSKQQDAQLTSCVTETLASNSRQSARHRRLTQHKNEILSHSSCRPVNASGFNDRHGGVHGSSRLPCRQLENFKDQFLFLEFNNCTAICTDFPASAGHTFLPANSDVLVQ